MAGKQRWVAVIGGATAGAEVTAYLAHRGLRVAVIEQHARPYGKIEDGLPRWHQALREKEFHHIDEKLNHPNVEFVPLTKVGRDIDFTDLATSWGFSAVVLACGAWKDRALPLAEAERFVGAGLHYQNPFVIAFNHCGDPGYEELPVQDGALVLGGGLAAIDVAKILMLETTRQTLAAQGISVSVVELEHAGIPATLKLHNLVWSDLKLAGCTIIYRRQAQDMPLVDLHGLGIEQTEKMHRTRLKLLHHAQEKFCFHLHELASPHSILSSQGRLVGMRFWRNQLRGETIVQTGTTFDLPTSLVVSAIGSVPELIKGIPARGELFDFLDPHLGTLPGFPNVFSVGNVVTGRGNIAASRKHARELSETAVSAFLGLTNERTAEGEVAQVMTESLREQAQATAAAVLEHVQGSAALSETAYRVLALQQKAGYGGNYKAWIQDHASPSGH